MQAYVDARGGTEESQEACYNQARAFLVVGLNHLAEPLLQRCLALPSELQRRAAYSSDIGLAVDDASGKEAGPATGHIFPQSEGFRRDRAVARWLREAAKRKNEEPRGAARSGEPPFKKPSHDPTNLHAEAAVNLARLHVQGGDTRRARSVLFQHIVW
jgi:hypothetical protein